MMLGMILLNLFTLPLVNYFESVIPKSGYQITAGLFALLALPMFWVCVKTSKETVVIKKENQVPIKESVKQICKNKNLLMIIFYTIFSMTAAMGRIGVAVYFYLHVANTAALTSIFMMMPMIMGALLMPIAPKAIEKFGKKNLVFFALIVQVIGLLIL